MIDDPAEVEDFSKFSWHMYVPLNLADDFLKCGWLPLDSLHRIHHGQYAVHMKWICQCSVPNPKELTGYLRKNS